jgi:prophage DNA circulation protein
MSYQDRLQQLVYTSPSGKEFTLRFTETTRERGKKAPVNEFPNQNQGGVQDLGQTTPRYPVNCYIDGADYDLTADRFWQALNESGPGELQHPRYGVIPVLPTSIRQVEQFIDGAGRATFEIDFVQADEISLEYPRTAALASASVALSAIEAGAAIADSVADIEIEELGQLAALKDKVLGGLDAVKSAFDAVTGFTDDVRQAINSTVQAITTEIDALIQAPQDLAESLLSLYRLPADTVTDVKAKIDGYAAILDTVVTAAVNTTTRYGVLFGLIGAADVNAASIAAAEASTAGTSATRASAIDAALALKAIADRQAAAIETLGAEDYESYYATRRALTLALDALIRTSLSLPAERVYITTEDITPIELAYQLYGMDGDVETLTDRIINYNDLTGESIILIPAGTEVRWYV